MGSICWVLLGVLRRRMLADAMSLPFELCFAQRHFMTLLTIEKLTPHARPVHRRQSVPEGHGVRRLPSTIVVSCILLRST